MHFVIDLLIFNIFHCFTYLIFPIIVDMTLKVHLK